MKSKILEYQNKYLMMSNNIITLLITLLISISCFAQNGINYKAVIKDNLGNVLVSETIDIKFTIIADIGSTDVYTETHTGVITDVNGIIILNIGEGTTTDVYTDITWSSDAHSLKTEIDTEQDGTYEFMSTTQFMAVPYALSAANVTGLETLDEGNGIGWRLIGRDSENYGDIGLNATDLSFNDFPSTTNGATGNRSFTAGYETTASGDYSTAMGSFTNALGGNSIAMGSTTTASGTTSTAMGIFTTASGTTSTTMGRETTASGEFSTAMGFGTIASGNNSTTMGLGVSAPSFIETTIGSYNQTYTPGANGATSWDPLDRLFTIGNGATFGARSNALVVLKNGTITAPSLDLSEITDDKALITREYYFDKLSNGSALERLDEGNGFGWKLKFQATQLHGDIGNSSIDLTTQATGNIGGATGDYATGIGFLSHAEGEVSTAIGWSNNSIGDGSIALGNHTTTTAFGSTAVGTYNVGGGNPDFPFATDPLFEIGNGSNSESSNAMTVLQNGNIGLGDITVPEEQLHLDGDVRINNAILKGSTDGSLTIGSATSGNGQRVGLFPAGGWEPYTNNSVQLGTSSFRWSEIWSVNPLNTSSDRRLKKDINPINYGLDAIMNLKPVSYKWKKGKQDTKLGFIAQDVESVVPEIVKLEKTLAKSKEQYKKEGRKTPVEDYYTMSYTELIPVLVKAIQELKSENDDLKERIEQLENK